MSPQRMLIIILLDVVGIAIAVAMWVVWKLGLYAAIPIVLATIAQFVLAIRFRKEKP